MASLAMSPSFHRPFLQLQAYVEDRARPSPARKLAHPQTTIQYNGVCILLSQVAISILKERNI